MDSSAFSELNKHGKWTITPEEYVTAARRYRDDIGNLDFCAIQDYMTEPWVLAKTGLTLIEHQELTVASLLELRALAPDLPWAPVLQGQSLADYLYCVELYKDAGVLLDREPIVLLGSVCKRQKTAEIGEIVERLHSMNIRLHGLGVKADGIRRYGQYLTSADSMAWSFRGRYSGPCLHGSKAKSESNCRAYAMQWRERVVGA